MNQKEQLIQLEEQSGHGRECVKPNREEKQEEIDENEARGLRLTERDRTVLEHLAITRYLTTAQIRQLVFEACDERVARRRLSALVDAKPALARKLSYRSFGGAPQCCW